MIWFNLNQYDIIQYTSLGISKTGAMFPSFAKPHPKSLWHCTEFAEIGKRWGWHFRWASAPSSKAMTLISPMPGRPGRWFFWSIEGASVHAWSQIQPFYNTHSCKWHCAWLCVFLFVLAFAGFRSVVPFPICCIVDHHSCGVRSSTFPHLQGCWTQSRLSCFYRNCCSVKLAQSNAGGFVRAKGFSMVFVLRDTQL